MKYRVSTHSNICTESALRKAIENNQLPDFINPNAERYENTYEIRGIKDCAIPRPDEIEITYNSLERYYDQYLNQKYYESTYRVRWEELDRLMYIDELDDYEIDEDFETIFSEWSERDIDKWLAEDEEE